MSAPSVFDNRCCQLGEGPLWHPRRQQLFWFDILENRLHSRQRGEAISWSFEEAVSAAGWVSETELLIASETSLFRFDLVTAERVPVHSLEVSNPATRSNDGRADPWGGFWISTMGWQGEAGAGSLYRYYQGVLEKLVSDLSIPNAICFAPDHSAAYYTDTVTQRIMRQPVNAGTGWPTGTSSVHIDLTGTRLNPDGAVTDAEGNEWTLEENGVIPNGSTVEVFLSVYTTSRKAIVGTRLDAVKVLEAAEMGGEEYI